MAPAFSVGLEGPFMNLQLHLDSIRYNFETDWVSGWIKGIECEHIEQITAVQVEIVQREEQGARTSKN
jgi:hypothetical protein